MFYENILNLELISMVKQSNDSTKTFKGIIYQFLIALEKCFELQEGEAVYIETFGDISILGNDVIQIESKYFNSYLTELDHNIWKTINNWMKDEFPLDNFSSLILLTTQKVKINSPWYDWNNKNKTEKYTILFNIKDKFLKQKKQSKETKTFIEYIYEDSRKNKLVKLIDIFFIEHNAIDDKEYYNKIKGQYSKNIPLIRADQYMNTMFGYILSPEIIENKWKISYEDFSKELRNITQQLVDTTTEFPRKINLATIDHTNYINNPFVEKIKEIEYDDVVMDAITNFVQTREMILQEFRFSPTIHASLKGYEDDVTQKYKISYRKSCRNCIIDKKINMSKDFYDDVMGLDSGTFYIYNSVPPYFYNGIMHILADESDDIVWLLNT